MERVHGREGTEKIVSRKKLEGRLTLKFLGMVYEVEMKVKPSVHTYTH